MTTNRQGSATRAPDEQATCPECDVPIQGVETRGPSKHFLDPCSHRVTTLTARDLTDGTDRGRGVATDGGTIVDYEEVAADLSEADGVVSATVETDDEGRHASVHAIIDEPALGTIQISEERQELGLGISEAWLDDGEFVVALVKEELMHR